MGAIYIPVEMEKKGEKNDRGSFIGPIADQFLLTSIICAQGYLPDHRIWVRGNSRYEPAKAGGG